MSQWRCTVLLKEKSILRKNPVLPIEKFTFLVLARNTIMLQHLIHFSRHYLSSGRLWEVKNKQKFQTKVIIVNQKRNYHSIIERVEIVDLHLKRVSVG